MHIPSPDTNHFESTTSPLRKRKRDVGGGAWGQENGHHNDFQGNIHFEVQDIDMLTSPTSISQRQWLHLQSAPNTVPGSGELAKKRKILQPHSHYRQQQQQQQQYLRPHSGNPVPSTEAQTERPPPPTLMIPFFNSHRDADISTSSLSVADDYDNAISPRTLPTPTGTDTSTKLVLRPCHVCHRKPSTKVMLDAYADCELCGQRACYVCLRECNASNCASQQVLSDGLPTPDERLDTEMRFCEGHEDNRRQRKICSLCAIEGLTDIGQEIVWCVDCVRREGVNH
ncbi:hypothetical protein TSTA_010520 [Talaromyces stipitatus ATCC 10500]|uniref:Uncharacterized protein n=1 Tax=Talaromyces stipitatus (strain ATCC 10500 / CBS 375.48 / QM 6759 / NRRL 1006) TaxID=441959 RepID=B8MG68_TALSN|nr:uncharacterized protein TSTA_010520 [Talaromyces stipitatus ATCC 10500]EED15935.1 hypothetical protein TSTA_010520 [Talaromyces stipitatus ATCC 10500]